MLYNINKHLILEVLTPNQQQVFNNQHMRLERAALAAGAVPVVGTPLKIAGALKSGHAVGEKLGYPTVGAVLGRDGVLGAMSTEPNSQVTLGDVYSKDNMITKGIGGAASGAGMGALAGEYFDPDGDVIDHIATGAAIGAATIPVVGPAMRYGLGKVFANKK